MRRKILIVLLVMSVVFTQPLFANAELASNPASSVAAKPIKVSIDYRRASVLMSDNSLWMWGENEYGQIGNGESGGPGSIVSSPQKIMTDVKEFFCSYSTSAAIKNDGSLWMWGSLKLENTSNSSIPVKIMDNVKTVYLNSQIYVIKNDDTLWAWGDNKNGYAGLGYNSGNIGTPTKIMDNVKEVTYRSAVKNDGTLWVWGGYNSDPPTQKLTNVKCVSRYADYYFMIRSDDSLWVCGKSNPSGELGFGDNSSEADPPKQIMSDVKEIKLGYHYSAAIKKDGSLWMWGYNGYHQVGNGGAYEANGVYSPYNTLNDVRNVVLDSIAFTSAAIRNDGSLWMWGNNEHGQIGNGTNVKVSNPQKIMNNVIDFDTYNGCSAAIKDDGSLWMWGNNQYGLLLDGTNNDSYVPKKITIGSNSGNDPSTPSGQSGNSTSSNSSTGYNTGNSGGSATSVQTTARNALFGVRLTKVTKGKKSFTAKWKKASKKQQKKFSGYQIQYSTRPDFSGWVKTKSTTKKKASKVVVRKLKAKTNYYIRLRRFKKSGGKIIYSDWSNVKHIRTK